MLAGRCRSSGCAAQRRRNPSLAVVRVALLSFRPPAPRARACPPSLPPGPPCPTPFTLLANPHRTLPRLHRACSASRLAFERARSAEKRPGCLPFPSLRLDRVDARPTALPPSFASSPPAPRPASLACLARRDCRQCVRLSPSTCESRAPPAALAGPRCFQPTGPRRPAFRIAHPLRHSATPLTSPADALCFRSCSPDVIQRPGRCPDRERLLGALHPRACVTSPCSTTGLPRAAQLRATLEARVLTCFALLLAIRRRPLRTSSLASLASRDHVARD